MAQEPQIQDQAGVRTYRCRAVIEALRWTDTDENREQFAAWFERHDAMFETRGAEIALPAQEAGLQALVPVGDWIVYDEDDGTFVGISHDSFTLLYEELR
jgi:hypothetical protein